MDAQIDNCPLCGEPNSLRVAYCRRCNYRLPWANALEGVEAPQKPRSATEQALDKEIKQWGLLPERTLACRYCEQRIEVDTKQCPHCQRWLVARYHEFEIDPWQPDYDDEAIKRVDTLKPRGGCVTVFLCITFITLWMRR